VTATAVVSTLPDAQLRRPEGLTLDREGNLWVADYGRDRVVKLAPDGRTFYVADMASNGVWLIDPRDWRKIRFQPATLGGKPIRSSAKLELSY